MRAAVGAVSLAATLVGCTASDPADDSAAADPAGDAGDHGDLDDATRAALHLAHAFGPSPAVVDEATVAASAALEPAAIIELAVWVSVSQALHRLTVRRLGRD